MITKDELDAALWKYPVILLDKKESRPNTYQIRIPIYYGDGDAISIYAEVMPDDVIRVCDFGMTYMRLSFSAIEPPQALVDRLRRTNGINDNNGNLYIDTDAKGLATAILAIAKIIIETMVMADIYRSFKETHKIWEIDV